MRHASRQEHHFFVIAEARLLQSFVLKRILQALRYLLDIPLGGPVRRLCISATLATFCLIRCGLAVTHARWWDACGCGALALMMGWQVHHEAIPVMWIWKWSRFRRTHPPGTWSTGRVTGCGRLAIVLDVGAPYEALLPAELLTVAESRPPRFPHDYPEIGQPLNVMIARYTDHFLGAAGCRIAVTQRPQATV
jgi:hypothetical protein